MWISKKELEKLISDKIEQSKEKRPKFIISSTDGKSYTCTYETRGLFKKYSVPIEVFDESKKQMVQLELKSPYEFAFFLSMNEWQLEQFHSSQWNIYQQSKKKSKFIEMIIE